MAHRRLSVTPSKAPVMTVTRCATKSRRLVYVICAPKPLRYPRGRSRVLYIGTTGVGIHRVASSMASKAVDFLNERGVKRLEVFAVTCPPRSGVDTWRRLERDMLIAFKDAHGSIPKGNRSGKNFTPSKWSDVFQYRRLQKILADYAK